MGASPDGADMTTFFAPPYLNKTAESQHLCCMLMDFFSETLYIDHQWI
jgi:hypothetical protein